MRQLTRPLLPGQKPVLGKKEIEWGQAMNAMSMDETGQWKNHDIYLHVNISDINQDLADPTLFVGRNPHQVRSLADSGVTYRFNEEAKRLELGLQDPVLRPEDNFDSMLPGSPHRFCLNCRDALNYFCRHREQQLKVSYTWLVFPISQFPSSLRLWADETA